MYNVCINRKKMVKQIITVIFSLNGRCTIMQLYIYLFNAIMN